MNAIEYRLDFATKAEAENALDYYENQPGYAGGLLMLPGTGETAWHLRVCFAAERVASLSDHSILTALGVVHADRMKANAG